MARHLSIKHIQLPQPHTRAPTTSNWHHQIRVYQSYTIAMTTHLGTQSQPTATATQAGTNHIQLVPSNTWVPNISNYHGHTRGNQTLNCHRHTRGRQPHPTGTTKLVGTNDIQLRWPQTWAPSTFNCHRQSRGRQPHPTATAIRVCPGPHQAATTTHAVTNHIQLAPPNSWVPITSNWHVKKLGHQTLPTATATHAGTNHIQLTPPNSGSPNFHCRTRRYKPNPTGTTKLVGTNHIQLPPPHAWEANHTQLPQPNTSVPITPNYHDHTRQYQTHTNFTAINVGANHIQLLPPHAWAPNHKLP